MHDSVTVSGAYGRDYKSKAAAMADWVAGLDFINHGPGGTYVSCREVNAISLRYDNKRKQVLMHKDTNEIWHEG